MAKFIFIILFLSPFVSYGSKCQDSMSYLDQMSAKIRRVFTKNNSDSKSSLDQKSSEELLEKPSLDQMSAEELLEHADRIDNAKAEEASQNMLHFISIRQAVLNYERGYEYSDGIFRGQEGSDKKAVEYFRKAAEAGLPMAQYHLSLMYTLGKGVPADKKKSIYWMQQAANIDLEKQSPESAHPAYSKGVVESQYHLGVAYFLGQGVPQDTEQAIHWIKKSADNGYEEAQKMMASISG